MDKHSLKIQLQQSLEDSQRQMDMLQGVILGQGYIVMVGESPIRFVADGSGYAVTAGVGKAAFVNRFTQEKAEEIAALVHNGHGEKGKAVFVRDAILMEIARIQSVIGYIDGEAN